MDLNFTSFLEKYAKVPVTEVPNNVVSQPLVSVCVQTYNQVSYIEKCLNGILCQKTSFKYEILLGEDFSSDGTRQLCLKFAKTYPDKIRLFLHSRENNINIGGRPTGRFNFFYNLLSAKGKYIAICEGDDYWTDPYKLQKQVDFLEGNPDYGLVHTDNDILYNSNGSIQTSINRSLGRNFNDITNITEAIVLGRYELHTLTLVFRNNLLNHINKDWVVRYLMGDLPLWLSFSKITKFYYIQESTAVYRKVTNSASNPKKKYDKLRFHESSRKVRFDFARRFDLSEQTISHAKENFLRAKLRRAFCERDSGDIELAFGMLKKKTLKDYIAYWSSLSNFSWILISKINKWVKPV